MAVVKAYVEWNEDFELEEGGWVFDMTPAGVVE